jgi:N-dimethylarginine dimethylaminohydrolase
MVNDTLHMMQTTKQPVANAERILKQLKEGDVIELNGKTFAKWAGLVVAPDMEAVEWMKSNVDAEFFNKYVVRIMHASPERFTMKIKY